MAGDDVTCDWIVALHRQPCLLCMPVMGEYRLQKNVYLSYLFVVIYHVICEFDHGHDGGHGQCPVGSSVVRHSAATRGSASGVNAALR